MTKNIILAAAAIGLIWAQSALADDKMHEMQGHHEHRQMDMHHDASHMNSGMKDGFIATKNVDGYQVTFHVMKAPEGANKGGTHHLMIKVEKSGTPVLDLIANSKASHPNGQSETKMMMKMGDWYMASYDLGHKGRHQLMVLFKTSDGKKHFVGIEYPAQETAK